MTCEACGGKGWITGQPFFGRSETKTFDLLTVQRCDLCERFESGWMAAAEASTMLPGRLEAVLLRERRPK